MNDNLAGTSPVEREVRPLVAEACRACGLLLTAAPELLLALQAERASAAQAMEVLRQIACMPRRTREQRLAKSCVDFLDSLREKAPNVAGEAAP